jgi:hypothetical protein
MKRIVHVHIHDHRFADEQKHDPKNGQFTSGGGSGGRSHPPKTGLLKEAAENAAKERAETRAEALKQLGISEENLKEGKWPSKDSNEKHDPKNGQFTSGGGGGAKGGGKSSGPKEDPKEVAAQVKRGQQRQAAWQREGTAAHSRKGEVGSQPPAGGGGRGGSGKKASSYEHGHGMNAKQAHAAEVKEVKGLLAHTAKKFGPTHPDTKYWKRMLANLEARSPSAQEKYVKRRSAANH